jgi:tripartite-type tricarboxylate transporter receptor subunit TctC
MTLPRRRFLQLVAGAGALAGPVRLARAQSYPARPLRVIVGDAAGGSPDVVARIVGGSLSERLGEPVVVENRPGAGGTIALEFVAKAPPDGYTLAVVTTSAACSAALYENLDYDLNRDFAPVASLGRCPLIMAVAPSFPAQTVAEFIAYAKANPGKINMASAGNGSLPHVAGELFSMMSGSSMTHVPFRGGPPALVAVLGGEAEVYFVAVSSAIEDVRAGKLRALAVTTAARWDGLPDVPAVAEFVPGYEASLWFGIGAPRNTPAEIVEKLNGAINAGLGGPEIKARLAVLGDTAAPMTSAAFGKLVFEETGKWAKVVKFAGAKLE